MITFALNGREVGTTEPGDSPLLWVLRDGLERTDVKYGCGRGLCGACTVLLDGEAVRSCVTPVAAVAGRGVETIAGLAARRPDHPLFRAWIDLDVVQCGYCQPGQLCQAAALLQRTPNPTDAEIDAAMAGNLCRCGTYERIRAGIHRAAQREGAR